MPITFINPSTNSDKTPVGSYGAVVPGSPDNIVTLPDATGTISLGKSMVTSGIISVLPGSGSSSTGTVTVSGLLDTDIVITSISTDASGSSTFFTRVNATADTITCNAYNLTGSSFVQCHYVVYR